jgi:renal tumor antigen
MHKYRLISKKGEGTFSEVMKAQNVQTGKLVAIKCMKNVFRSIEQVNSLREIQALRRLNPHDNIIELEDVLYDKSSGRLALVFELMDMNIYEMIRNRKTYVDPEYVRLLMWQLMKAVHHMHSNGIFHRDIKPENVLVMDKTLKVADFGSCRGIHTKQPFTEYISTRWYRAPECLLTNGYYGAEMDVWGIGCVLFEIVALFPLFPGTNELDQIERVHNILGTPAPEVLDVFKKHGSHLNIVFEHKQGTGIDSLLSHVSKDCVDLIKRLITYNPEQRPATAEALLHPYFAVHREAEQRSVNSSAIAFSPSSQVMQRKEQRKKKKEEAASKEAKEKLPVLPSLGKGGEKEKKGGEKDKDKFGGTKMIKLKKDKNKFNSTSKDLSLAGSMQIQGKFKPNASINLGGGNNMMSDGEDADIVSADEGPFSDVDADSKALAVGGNSNMSQTLEFSEVKKERRVKNKKHRRKNGGKQPMVSGHNSNSQETYVHIGNNIAKLGKQQYAKQQPKKSKESNSNSLPLLGKTSLSKNQKSSMMLGSKEQKLAKGPTGFRNPNDNEDESENSSGGLANLMVTTQYKINRKAQKKESPKQPPFFAQESSSSDKFSIHKSFAQQDTQESSTLSAIVNVRKLES